jgi:dihydrofolate reductase
VTGKARVAFVVAVAENGVIGHQGHLPWRMPTDLKRFRALTLGKPMIMGRKTYDSIGKALDGRDTIVLTRRTGAKSPPGVHLVSSVAEALSLARTLAAGRGVDEITVIGGAEVFRATLPETDRVYLTVVRGNPPGETHFDPLDPSVWRETAREPMSQGAKDQYAADFVVLDRHSKS